MGTTTLSLLLVLFLGVVGCAHGEEATWTRAKCGVNDQVSQWGLKVDPNNVLPEYPRPQFVRPDNTWKNLNGIWQFQPANGLNDQPPFGQTLSSTILVPFPVESCLSGIATHYQYMWYRLVFDTPARFNQSETLLHFAAVDWMAKVWVNKKYIGEHSGGYDRFEFSISDALQSKSNELIVFVYDPTNDGPQPAGKQNIDSMAHPGGDAYTPASGIWGIVWMENVPKTYIHELRMTTSLTSLTITAFVKPNSEAPQQGYDHNGGDIGQPIQLKTNDYYSGCFELCKKTNGCVGYSFGIPLCDGLTSPTCWLKSSINNRTQQDCRISGRIDGPVNVLYEVLDGSTRVASVNGQSSDAVTINIPSPKLWSPTSPYLYNLRVSINGDVITSYFGLRTVSKGQFQHSGASSTGVQNGVDRSGADMAGSPYQISNADPTICDNDCKNKPGCKAWAYAVPGCDGYAQPTCWLKSTAQTPGANKCRASGAMGYDPFTAARMLLNNQPVFLAAWLDQSFWPDGIYTAPTDAALAFDLQAVKMFGLNSVRLHQKVNSERWYYWADKLGIVIMQDMIQKFGGASADSIPLFTREFYRMVGNQYNHPSIVQWEIFNEGDCVETFNVPVMLQIARDLDSTRMIDTNSGGPANDLHIGDVNDVHTYPNPGFPTPSATQYGAIGEFGGIGAYIPGHEWSTGCFAYQHTPTPQNQVDTYVQMVQTIISHREDVCISVVTQITDVEDECDGFLNYDRTNKFSTAQTATIAAINRKLASSPTVTHM